MITDLSGPRIIRIEVKYRATGGIDSVRGVFDFPDSIYRTINSHEMPVDEPVPHNVDWNDIVKKLTSLAEEQHSGR